MSLERERDKGGRAGDVAGARDDRRRLYLLAGTMMAAVLLGFVFMPVKLAGSAVRWGAFWFLLATSLGWAMALRHVVRESPRATVRWGSWEPFAWAVGMVTLAIGAEGAGFKVVLDEFVLENTAWQMHVLREAAVPVRAFVIDGVMLPIDSYVDKRPTFFPFLLTLIHSIAGYRPANAFLLNGALLVAHVLLVWHLVRGWLGIWPARIAVLLWATTPLLMQNARGAGMDLLNLVMIEGCAVIAAAYVRRPTPARQSLLLLHGVMLAQTRYESAIYIGIVGLIVAYGWWRERRMDVSNGLIAAPFLLLPYAWQHRMVAESPQLWELPPELVARFGWQHLSSNLTEAWRFFFAWRDPLQANSPLVAGLGTIGALFAVVRLTRSWRRGLEGNFPVLALALVGGGVLVNMALLMFYYWGRLSDPVAARLALPLHAWLVFAATWFLHRSCRLERFGLSVSLLIALFLLGISRPQMAVKHYTVYNLTSQELEWEQSVVEKLPPSPRLVISNKSSLPWLMRGVPALHMDYARLRVEQLEYHWKRRTFPEVIVTQFLQATDEEGAFAVPPDQRLPGVRLDPVAERRFGARLLRVSRVVAIDAALASVPPSKTR